MKEILDRFAGIAGDPFSFARQWKEEGKGKVVGCNGLYVPEEIIHAAGMLPVVILEKEGPITKAQAHIQNVMCGYIRSFVDQGVAGDLDFMDCVVAHDCCHVLRMMLDILERNAPGMKRIEPIFFPVPIKKPHSWTFILKELQSLISRMEDVSGNKITDESLKASIDIFDKHRQLLKQLYQIRREKPGVLSAVQVSNIVKASMLMDKEEHNALLEQLIGKLGPVAVPKTNKVPLILSGSLCETCDEYVLKAVEEAGGEIVDDDLYVGSRYFATEVGETIPPIEALAYAYVNMVPPCPTRHDERNSWGEYVMGVAKNAGAKGIVSVMVKYCEAHGYGYLMVHRKLRENNIPEYLVETEHEVVAPAQVKTRLQGFIESINDWRVNR